MSDLEEAGTFGVLIGLVFGVGPFMGAVSLGANLFLSLFLALLCVSLAAQAYARSLRARARAQALPPRDKLKTTINEFYTAEGVKSEDGG